jgi:multiple sugar transport system permease protein
VTRLLFLLPAAALVGGLIGAPLALTIARAAGHYGEALADPRLGHAALVTAAFAAVSVTLEMALGLLVALALDAAWRMRGLLRAIAILPWALPSAVMALSWRWIFNDTAGLATALAMAAGLTDEPVAWLGRPALAFAAVVAADVWKATPFVTIILLAGLQSIPRDLYEAMSLDGAGPVRRFVWVTLPLLRPAIALALSFRLIQAVGVFDLVWVMTGGGPADATRTVALYIYDVVFRFVRPDYGAAVTALVAVALLVLATAAGLLTRGRALEERQV